MAKNTECLAFFLWVTSHDRYHLPRLLRQIREVGHTGDVLALSDGRVEPFQDFSIIQTHDRLKNYDVRLFLKRQSSLLLQNSDAEHFIQVDPDSEVWWMPPVPDSLWAGQIIRSGGIIATWGCGTYFSRAMIQLIADEPIQKGLEYSKGGCADLTIGAHLNSLGYYPEPWQLNGEKVCKLESTPSDRVYSRKWAITHPVSPAFHIKVLCLGLSKTGTTSMSAALKVLGYKSIHFPRVEQLPRLEAATDTSAVAFWLNGLLTAEKYILLVRDIESWLASCENHWQRYPDQFEYIRQQVYGIIHFDKKIFRDTYKSHCARVESSCSPLLKMEISNGWYPLCQFLNKSVPDQPFPHINKTHE